MAFAAATTTSPVASASPSTSSEAADPPPPSGRVSRLRQNWSVFEDGALAERLQSQEIEQHYGGNRRRNVQIRQDFPEAVREQTRERTLAELQHAEELRRLQEVQERDAEVALRMEEMEREQERQEQMRQFQEVQARDENMARMMEEQDREHRQYELTRDEVFARRIQMMEQQQRQQQASSSPDHPPQPRPATPPLPVTANGDVPSLNRGEIVNGTRRKQPRDTTFHDLQGGLRYNDDQYLLKTARPAMVTSEPVYANNQPEHYAVSRPVDVTAAAEAGAVPLDPDTVLLGAAGLSQKDLALSKRAEEQLEQERRDQELARRLQEQLSSGDFTDDDGCRHKAELEAKDLELAKQLHAKERAKLKRAKERAKLKKLEQERARKEQEEQQQQQSAAAVSPLPPANEEELLRAESRTGSRLSRRSDHSHELEEVSLPARRPYMNREAIDTREVSGEEEEEDEAVSNEQKRDDGNVGLEEEEPQYENIIPKHLQQRQQVILPSAAAVPAPATAKIVPTANLASSPPPPYMPMQQSSSRKSSSLEKRINKKKEKEGCKQQ